MDKGIILMGEAAESYVRLQWIEFYTGAILFVIFIIGFGIFLYAVIKDARK